MAGNGIVPNADVQDDLSFPVPEVNSTARSGQAFPLPEKGGVVAPPRKKEYFNAVDVAKGTGSGIERGAADVAGMGGDLPQFGGNIAEYAIQKAAEKLGYVPPGGKEIYERGFSDIAAENEKLGKPMLPTSEDIKKVAAPLGTEYKPTSEWGERAQSGAESGVSNLVGGPEGMVGRAVAGTAGGILGTTARQNMGDNPYAAFVGPMVDILGQAATGHLIDTVKNLPTSTRAQTNIMQALAADFADGSAKVTPAQLQELIKTGVPLNIADLGGKKTTELLNTSMGRLPPSKVPTSAARYNTSLNPKAGAADVGETSRLADSQARMENLLTHEAGAPLNPASMTDQIEKSGRAELDDIYDVARDPKNIKGNSIYASDFDPALQGNPYFQKSIANAADLVNSSMKPEAHIIPSWSENTGERPGNLAYWDLVKRDLDTQYKQLMAHGNTQDEQRALQILDVKKALVSRLDEMVPEYQQARGAASEFFQSRTAPEAGANFYGKMDSFDAADAAKNYNGYSDTQKAYFKNGFLSEMNNDMGRPGGAAVLAKKMTTDPDFQQKAQMVLGPSYKNIRNSILAEDLSTSAKKLAESGTSHMGGMLPTVGAAVTGGAMPIYELLTNEAFRVGALDPNYLLGVVPGMVVGAAAAKRAKSVAQKTIELATSGKAEDMEDVVRLASHNPVAQRTLERMNRYSQAANQQGAPLEASGGRIGRASGGRTMKDPKKKAESLILLAEKIKKEEGKNTSSLLNLDDTTVAKALAVANKHI